MLSPSPPPFVLAPQFTDVLCFDLVCSTLTVKLPKTGLGPRWEQECQQSEHPPVVPSWGRKGEKTVWIRSPQNWQRGGASCGKDGISLGLWGSLRHAFYSHFILNDTDHRAKNYWSTDTYPETAAALHLVAISATQLWEAVNRWQFSGISGQPDT